MVFTTCIIMSAVSKSKSKVFCFRTISKTESNHGGGGDGGKISSIYGYYGCIVLAHCVGVVRGAEG